MQLILSNVGGGDCLKKLKLSSALLAIKLFLILSFYSVILIVSGFISFLLSLVYLLISPLTLHSHLSSKVHILSFIVMYTHDVWTLVFELTLFTRSHSSLNIVEQSNY